MATISVVFTSTAGEVIGVADLVDDGDVARILEANKIYLGTEDDQATANKIAQNLTTELIGNTTTIERNQIPVNEIKMVQEEAPPESA